MKHIVIIFSFILMAVSASAQVNPSAPGAGLSYSHKTFYLDGQALSGDQVVNVLGNDMYSAYRKARGLKTAGIICTAAGGACLVGGGIGLICAGTSDNVGDTIVGTFIGAPLAVGGGVIAVSGIVMWCVGSSKIKKIPVTYNSRTHSTAYLTPASTGMGLALNF